MHFTIFFFPARKPLSTVTNASIAYIAGFVAKAVEERRMCTACPCLHEAHSSSPELVGLISLSTRGSLTFPKPEFVAVLAAMKKAADFAVPHIGTKDVRQKLANITPTVSRGSSSVPIPVRQDAAKLQGQRGENEPVGTYWSPIWIDQ